jgi:enoyl-CoA hydratase
MSETVVATEIVERIGVLTFDRPRVLNAFDPALIRESLAALTRFEQDSAVLAVVVRGAGRAFSAGFDLKAGAAAAATRTAADWRRILEEDFDFIMRFWDCPKPTVAAVHGYCLGGAFELALACDVTVAAAGTRFGEPEVRFGSGVVAMLLPWFAGPKASKELLLTGEDKLDAERARALGVVNRVAPDGEEFGEALAIARDMAAAAPDAVRRTKRAIHRSYDAMGFRQALRQALEIDIEIEASGGPEREAFNRIRREQGLKAALAWRDARAQRPQGG